MELLPASKADKTLSIPSFQTSSFQYGTSFFHFLSCFRIVLDLFPGIPFLIDHLLNTIHRFFVPSASLHFSHVKSKFYRLRHRLGTVFQDATAAPSHSNPRV